MSVKDIQAVTGAFGFSGKYIARRLLDKGHQVITLTDSAQRVNPFAGKVKAYPFNFDIPERLTESLKKEKIRQRIGKKIRQKIRV
jgi:NADH dehydrogenase